MYVLCWCRRAGGIECRHKTSFVVEVGTLSVQGPALNQKHQCQSTEACVVNLAWLPGVAPVEGRLAVAVGESCNGTFAAGFPGGAVEGTVDFLWPNVTASGGVRALCWCGVPEYDVPDACSKKEDFLHQIGHLDVVGPSAAQTFTCMAGEACSISPIRGELADGFTLLLRSAGFCGDPLTQGCFNK